MGALEEAPLTSILEEFLFALLGYSGDVFVDTLTCGSNSNTEEAAIHEPPTSTFHLSEDIDFVSASDREVINRLLELGYRVRSLEAFVKQEELSWSRPGGSQYRCALANGIQELLGVYRAAILQVQQHLRSTASPSLATLNYFLTEFKILLPVVHRVVHKIQTRDVKGNGLLKILHNEELRGEGEVESLVQANSGILEVQSCLGRLQWHCHQVLYKQLTAWMVHGLLTDQCEEFFIQRKTMPERQPVSSSPSQEDTRNADEWHNGFEASALQIRMDLLPPEITGDAPKNIEFIGKAVRMLRPPQGSSAHDQLGAAAALKRLRAAPSFDATQFDFVIEGIRAQAAERLWQLVLVQGNLPLHLNALQDYFLMSRGDFHQSFLLESHMLMKLPPVPVVAEANINVHFQQAAQKSSAESDPLFANLRVRCPTKPEQGSQGTPAVSTSATPLVPPSACMQATATPAYPQIGFQPSAAYIDTANTTRSRVDRASAYGTRPTAGKARGRGARLAVPEYDGKGWDALTLEYQVKWPLQLLLSQEDMDKYNGMFQYLFRLKRLQLELERCWAVIHRRSRRVAFPAAPRGMPPLWQVRSHMAYFISNLQLYIQVDVIEVQSSKLKAEIQGVRELKAAENAHKAFLTACIVQSCLDVPALMQNLSKLLKICKAFCKHLQKDELDWENELPGYPRMLVDDFQHKVRLIYTMLSAPLTNTRDRAACLRQLLLRLNFNDYMQQDTDRHAPASYALESKTAEAGDPTTSG